MTKKNKKDKQHNVFLYSPGGDGPYALLDIWSAHMEYETSDDPEDDEDNWMDALSEFVSEQDVDYGCYAMTREGAEQLYEKLGKLLGK
jgi:hypothetical protein